MSDDKLCREMFESATSGKYGHDRFQTGMYKSDRTSCAWDGFQAAWNARIPAQQPEAQQEVRVDERWEYKYSVLPAHSDPEKWLNKLGDDGWQLCSKTDNGEVYFKRPYLSTPIEPTPEVVEKVARAIYSAESEPNKPHSQWWDWKRHAKAAIAALQSTPQVAEPTEAMCDAARPFIVGLDMNIRNFGDMRLHLDRGGNPVLPYIKDMAEQSGDAHITKWDVADCIFQYMMTARSHLSTPTPAATSTITKHAKHLAEDFSGNSPIEARRTIHTTHKGSITGFELGRIPTPNQDEMAEEDGGQEEYYGLTKTRIAASQSNADAGAPITQPDLQIVHSHGLVGFLLPDDHPESICIKALEAKVDIVTAAPKHDKVSVVAAAIKRRMQTAKASDGSACDHSHYFAESAFVGMAQAAIAALKSAAEGGGGGMRWDYRAKEKPHYWFA